MVDFLLDEDIWFTVESCSWMSIMWSPSLMVRFRGAAPDRKSLTWKSELIRLNQSALYNFLQKQLRDKSFYFVINKQQLWQPSPYYKVMNVGV